MDLDNGISFGWQDRLFKAVCAASHLALPEEPRRQGTESCKLGQPLPVPLVANFQDAKLCIRADSESGGEQFLADPDGDVVESVEAKPWDE